MPLGGDCFKSVEAVLTTIEVTVGVKAVNEGVVEIWCGPEALSKRGFEGAACDVPSFRVLSGADEGFPVAEEVSGEWIDLDLGLAVLVEGAVGEVGASAIGCGDSRFSILIDGAVGEGNGAMVDFEFEAVGEVVTEVRVGYGDVAVFVVKPPASAFVMVCGEIVDDDVVISVESAGDPTEAEAFPVASPVVAVAFAVLDEKVFVGVGFDAADAVIIPCEVAAGDSRAGVGHGESVDVGIGSVNGESVSVVLIKGAVFD